MRRSLDTAVEIQTSKMAADMPSETDELTTANDFLMAVWSSSWLLSTARNTPADLQPQTHKLVEESSGKKQHSRL